MSVKIFKNIALTGMMGCGKSTIAKELINLLDDYVCIEMDEEIENRAQISINEIFEKYGENHFRTLEAQLVQELVNKEKQVISMGGGAFLSEENRVFFLENSFTVYLKTTVDAIYERIKNDSSRPLLKTDDVKGRIKELIKIREPFYELAHIEVCTDNKNPKEIAKEILEKYKEYGN